jgi:hypothetical protein
MHSIDYASVIQRSLLRPSNLALSDALDDAHLEWQPRDVVGGDFYHFAKYEDGWFAAIADCTGHGVPGAFMTLISSSTLTQALQQLGPRDPARLIAEVNRGVKGMLGQVEGHGHTESNDGMDAAFLWFDNATRQLHFAGAKLSLFQLDPDQQAVQTVDGERMGVGYTDTPLDYQWANKTIAIPEGSLLFLTTDGLIDQIGGAKDIAYGKRRMRDVLLAKRTECAPRVAAMLDDYQAWQGEQPRRDDLTFFCFRPERIPLLYEEFNDFFDVARKRHIIFFYVGYFSQHVVAAISETIKARLDGRRGRADAAPHLLLVRRNVAEHHALLVRHAHARRASREPDAPRLVLHRHEGRQLLPAVRQSGRQRQCGTHPQPAWNRCTP